ncbi:homoprotocatechuate catabolism bifunctional isomerase/decarboxylase [Pseudovirgaria hyperparasitica]|uniref:Homoprotocatechuate catabolism bifunctional isomerase/decarboxylase n=1 Tax=Pseudovirgaria hyperparasitica TaxID=470096 RepID=A0A6A6WDD0_9PEZI|nr:homoprotocatechuate catabolism bifunctional isomerase/decarboxylase [Pseudovirgaria hyperparasitica]KAF2759567.1 homoprotocatechuate catabolism bifunctional isomerase/decarboxylase [Pseudovirgaria hyperparasitica]
MAWQRLLRFHPRSDRSKTLIGQPFDAERDIGLAVSKNEVVQVRIWSGSSVLSPGQETTEEAVVGQLLSPLAQEEVGTIRCIGLNYKQHAEEAGMTIPTVPTVFMKPSTALSNPYPTQLTTLPHETQSTMTGDYESELTIIISKSCKNVSEADAMNYVLGYTAANDVSSRSAQFATTQWSYSKGFDESCPIGPVVVSKDLVPDPAKLHLRGLHNGKVVQDCGINDLIFSIPKLVSFLSQGTTLPAGTIVITGTPAGVGAMRSPKITLKHGDEFGVEILPYIGTLVNKFVNEV